jgi:tetratricopeptide (TPR) repeat protein
VALDRERVLSAAQKYVEKKKYDRAVVEYQKVIQEDPNDARTLLKIGDLQSKMEAYADAVATYERVGKFYASQGFALKAIAVYKQIREIVGKHLPQLEDRYAHIAPKLAELYQQLGLTSDALAALDEVATRLQRQSRDAEAIDVFRKIAELDPANPLPHLRLAEAFSRVRDGDAAVTEFATAAGQLLKLGRRDDALKVLERLLHHRPDPTHARIAAEQYLARGNPNDGMLALAKLQISFQANPRDLDTLGLLAKAFNQIGQAAKAIEVQKEMARIARDNGKTELFREILGRLLKLAPNDETVRALTMVSSAPVPASAPAPHATVPDSAADDGSELDAAAEHVESESSYEDVVDSDIESDEPAEPTLGGAEDLQQPAAGHDSERVVRVLAEAASFRRARVHVRAIDTLRAGLEQSPRAVEMLEMLRDVLLDVGRTQEAVEVMLRLAALEIDGLNGEGAARILQDVLAIAPDNAQAIAMLGELGYELVEEPAPSVMPAELGDATRDGYDQYGAGALDEPLPAYELDEADAGSVTDTAVARPSGGPDHLESIDDPFAEGPLPSFPLEAPETGAEAPNDEFAASTSPPPAVGAPELEAALEEAEFFTSRGLFDDARVILLEQLARLPNHPLVLERIAELEEQLQGTQVGSAGSGTRPSPSAETDGREEAARGEDPDRAFDIAESLRALDAVEPLSEAGEAAGRPTDQVDVEEVFAKFKEGVAKQIGVDDAQSHYDLGVAYKEMGLLPDAIREFETAARDPKRACVCQSMIGSIHIERGSLNEAIDAFLRGLQATDRTKDQEAVLCYEVGAAYEAKKVEKQALEYFQRTMRLNPHFRDVQDRVRRLQPPEPKPAVRAVAVGADDEFDRVFDDILGGAKGQ